MKLPLRLPVLALALGAAFAAGATLVRGPSDVETMARDADTVVRATVVERSSGWAPGGRKSGRIVTRVLLRPLEWWKGAGTSDLDVVVPGGVADELEQTVPGAVRFQAAEEVVVFLRRNGPTSAAATWDVVRWSLGKFSIAPRVAGQAPGPARAIRDRSGIECVGCAPGESDELSVDELRSRVRRGLGRPR